MADQRIDPRIYGAVPLDAQPERAAGTAPVAEGYVPPVAVPAVDAVSRSTLVSEGAASIFAENNRVEATALEGMGAAISQWSPKLAYDYFAAPKFDWAANHNPVEMLRQVDFQLDKTQEAFLLETKSPAEFQHRLENMREQNLAYKAMGEGGAAAFAVAMLDPGYLAIDVAALGLGRAAKLAGMGNAASRMVAGGTAGLGAYVVGKMEQDQQPVSEKAVILNAMMNGAATAAFFRAGKVVDADPEFPGAALHNIVEDVRARDADVADTAAVRQEKVVVRPVEAEAPTIGADSSEVPVRTVSRRADAGGAYKELSGFKMLDELAAGPDELVGTMARRVRELLVDDVEVRQVPTKQLVGGARAYYDPGQHIVFISKSTRPEMRLHEMTHALTAYKIAYGAKNAASAHGKIVSEMQATLETARRVFTEQGGDLAGKNHTAYYLANLDEFVAGVFSGKSEFTDMLAGMPVAPGAQRSVLGSIVDSIRRILGMGANDVNGLTHMVGLTEALAKEKLHITFHRGQLHGGALDGSIAPGNMSIRLAPEDLRPLAAPAAKRAVAKALGKGISWSLHKTLAGYSATAKKVADLLVDDPLDMVGNSVVSQHRAIRADLQAHQIVFENLLANRMAEQGFGLSKRITSPRKALVAQRAIERDVLMEMLRRNRLSMDGVPITHAGVAPHVKEMADSLDVISKHALAEMKRSGVSGADTITEHFGYISRRWDIAKIEEIEGALMAGGMTMDAARLSMRDSMSVAIQRANGWDAELASDVAKAILDRTRSKGYFEDSAFRRGIGDDGLAEIRNILTGSGISGARMQRVIDVLAGKTDEAGKASMLKHRVDMALDETITLPDGTSRTLADMLDTNVTGITERYLDNVSSQAAFARKGLTKASDITKLRSELLESIPTQAERERAKNLFDNTVASLRGDPVGEDLPDFMRKSQAVTQMVGLARAGMFQFTEYSTAMAHYGAARTVAEMFKEMPGVRQLLGDAKEAEHLSNILSRNSSMDFRIRPFINRLEDNFEVPVSDAVQMALMQAKQLVPYLNALKYVQGHQSRVVANLVVNTFERGARGDVRALAALEQYGLESHIMGQIRSDIAAHGMDTAKWSDATWDAVRAPLTKMMDDAVLRNRTGEIPAFAQFTSTGKFIFTFRSFVLGAHNKVLAGSLNRGGFQGLGLIMLYQFPLTFAATSASHTLAGKKPMDDKEAIGAAFSQMGSLGLLSEAVGVALQNKQQFGSPGTIAWDRVYKLGSAVAAGDAGNAGAAALNSVPLLSIILPVKAIGENLKGN